MADSPTGTVTFLFTDIQGSTAMWERDAKRMQLALARHDEIMKTAVSSHGGHEENEAALREYFDQMARLLLERDLLDSQDGDEVQDLARARTLAAISASDAEDNKSLTRFLSDMDLVKGSDPVRLLQRSYLPNVDLSGAFLPAADLYVSSLRGADLSGAFLISANLGGSILSDADLKGADLMYANLDHTELDGADLRDADLTRASLEEADLSGANLSGATVTKEQLDTCKSITNATMPDGSRHP